MHRARDSVLRLLRCLSHGGALYPAGFALHVGRSEADRAFRAVPDRRERIRGLEVDRVRGDDQPVAVVIGLEEAGYQVVAAAMPSAPVRVDLQPAHPATASKTSGSRSTWRSSDAYCSSTSTG